MDIIEVLYAGKQETPIRKTASSRGKRVNTVLLGTWLGVTEKKDGYAHVVTAGPDGWVKLEDTNPSPGLKIFFIDIGQGDATLIEVDGKRILVDAGPSDHVKRYLKGWQYSYELKKPEDKVHIDIVVISHFDYDHFNGVTDLLKDKRISIGKIYHNGIARFDGSKKKRPNKYNSDLGKTRDGAGGDKVLETSFSTLSSLLSLCDSGGFMKSFKRFADACESAHGDDRLGSLKRLTTRDDYLPGFGANDNTTIEILGPVPESGSGIRYKWFNDSSHTRNGHSIVMKMTYSGRTFLLGGDLNSESEEHLLAAKGKECFKVDMAKACHHGSSDFTIDYMKAVNPFATVFSSGDNESHAHPRADAIGCAGRYSRGVRPLVFSTELARSVKSSGEILYGMINVRCYDGEIVMAQMKEKASSGDIWDSYSL